MAQNDNSSSGDCGPVSGLSEFMAAAGGARTPRRPRRGEQTARVTLDGTRSAEMGMLNNAAREAQGLVNSGASDIDGTGPVSDPAGLLSSGGGRPSGSTSSDPSSLEAQR